MGMRKKGQKTQRERVSERGLVKLCDGTGAAILNEESHMKVWINQI